MGFFSRRKQRESANPAAAEAPGADAEPVSQPPEPVGEMVQGTGPAGFDLSSLMGPGAGVDDLGATFSMIGQAIKSGQAQVHVNQGGERVIDLSNTADAEQIRQALAQAGIQVDVQQLEGRSMGAWREGFVQGMRDAGFGPETMQGDLKLPGQDPESPPEK